MTDLTDRTDMRITGSGDPGSSAAAGNTIPDRIDALRNALRGYGFAACIVPTADPHLSEYVSDHYKVREYLTGFTGSAGTAVITDGDAALWTDSRYWLQAEEELSGSGVFLMRDGEDGTPSIPEWLCEKLGNSSCASSDRTGIAVWVDGACISAAKAGSFRDALAPRGIRLETGPDLIGGIWTDRPPLDLRPVTDHPARYAGLRRSEKIDLIRRDLLEASAMKDGPEDQASDREPALILPALDDIAWLLNLRGSDIHCNPVFYSYVILTLDRVRLYAQPDRFSPELPSVLAEDGVDVLPYDRFYEDLSRLKNIRVAFDPSQCNAQILQSLPESACRIDTISPVLLRKCVKNPVEMDGIRAAHLRDGVALCRFLYWLKQQRADGNALTDAAVGQPITELSAAVKLSAFRSAQEGFRGESFDPIIAYGPHGAIVHYSANEQSNAVFEPRGLLLIDSGGQYTDGTTDITRTIALGPLTDEEKRCFTAVLRGHIGLARARFREGCGGAALDVLARQPLWEEGLDYGHGTGHGVGAYLNVHEAPLRIHWSAKDQPAFAPGMLVSDEPGYYEAGRFGIRHENLLLCVPAGGGFLGFESVTLVPFDLEGIDPERMQPDEIAWLNAYHRRVFEAIAPYLDSDERAWLAEATRPIGL